MCASKPDSVDFLVLRREVEDFLFFEVGLLDDLIHGVFAQPRQLCFAVKDRVLLELHRVEPLEPPAGHRRIHDDRHHMSAR